MKIIPFNRQLLAGTILLFIVACKKDSDKDTQPPVTSQPPVAEAGANQTVNFPLDSVELIGSGTDADGRIVSYYWQKISGPGATILQAHNARTMVIDLRQGVYEFQLLVRDDQGFPATDTVSVIVTGMPYTLFNIQLVSRGTISEFRKGTTVAAAGNKLLFAGGHLGTIPSSKVDIYDIAGNTWSVAELFEARVGITAARNGNQLFFTGGATQYDIWSYDDSANNWYGETRNIDVYDAITGNWSVKQLPQERGYMAWAVAGSKILYSNGSWVESNRVDVYDLATGAWSVAMLPESRGRIASVAAGGKVFFAGGIKSGRYLNRVDILDIASGSWSSTALSRNSHSIFTAASGDKVFFCLWLTENYGPPRLDTYDLLLLRWTSFPLPIYSVAGIEIINDKLFLLEPGDLNSRLLVHDLNANTWKLAQIPSARVNQILSSGDKLFGTNGYQLWEIFY
jgi:hypothetical protein